MENVRQAVQFVFTGQTIGEALAQMQEHLDGDLLDGYQVTHVLLVAMTVYWRVVVVCLPERAR